MELNWTNVLWILLTALCFGAGFALSWRSQKKRIQQRYIQAVEQELQKRLAEEVMRQITQGPDAGNTNPKASEARHNPAKGDNGTAS